jgi:ABC-type sugar transport system substrate-binding protein
MKAIRNAILLMVALVLPSLTLSARAADWDDGQILKTQELLKGKRVGYVPISMSIDLTQAWYEGIRRDSERYGYELVTRDPNWNVQVGAQAINQLIGENVDLLIIHSLDAQSYAKPIERARAAGIPVVQINLKSLANSEAYVGVNYYEIYIKAAEAMVGLCGKDSGNNGKIALVQGTLTTSGSIAGRQALADYFANHPDIQIVAEQAADWDATKAQAVTSTILKQNPDLCGIIGFWEVQDMGTAAAIKEAGLQGKVHLITTGGG